MGIMIRDTIITVILVALCAFSLVKVVRADATAETGDTRARPVSAYGIQTDGTLTAILVDSDGVVQTS